MARSPTSSTSPARRPARTDKPLKLPKYHYGGLGVRGTSQWNPVDAVTMLTSEGHDRKAGDNTKAKWVHLGGEVDGTPTGIAVSFIRATSASPSLSV
jgi:hypothetical protein